MVAARDVQAHDNIAVNRSGGSRKVDSWRHGTGADALEPRSSFGKKPLKQLPATFNARAEGAMLRDAFKRHRCVMPASGYYKWLARPDGKHPYIISAADGGTLSFASLWDRWNNPETG